jgi:hypothetical protein
VDEFNQVKRKTVVDCTLGNKKNNVRVTSVEFWESLEQILIEFCAKKVMKICVMKIARWF